jgi:phosphoheptose isomerase
MNNIIDRLKHCFSESIQTKINTADLILPTIGSACEKMVRCLLDGTKILTCGNGGSACDAMHFANEMLNRYKHERPILPAIALVADPTTLTAIGNDYNFTEIFAKQLRALGQPGDILLAITTSGNSANVIHAVKAAHDRNVNVIAMTGHDGGKIAHILGENDIEIRVPANDTPRIQETHLLIIHCICDIIDYQLFGHDK